MIVNILYMQAFACVGGVSVCVHTYKGEGQRTTCWSQFPPPRGFQRSNSICQAWWQLLSPTQPISPTQTKCLIMKIIIASYCIESELEFQGSGSH